MISARKYMRATVFCGLFVVVTGGLALQNMLGKAVAQDESEAAQDNKSGAEQEAPVDAAQEDPATEQEAPVDAAQEEPAVEQEAPADATQEDPAATEECFESIKGATELSKKDNVVSKYGYPNVKCSPTTKAVLWYGDPYYDTEQMEAMPTFGDHTDGDFAHAVIRPRAKSLKTQMQCSGCHPSADPTTQKNDPRQIMNHQDIVSNAEKLQHGRGAIWCFDCHNAANRDTLVDLRGQEVNFDASQKLCGSCHGDIYSDWRMGLHGKRIGEWKVGGKKRWWTCTECHNPHTVQEHRFQPLQPEPPPALPRGMTVSDFHSHE